MPKSTGDPDRKSRMMLHTTPAYNNAASFRTKQQVMFELPLLITITIIPTITIIIDQMVLYYITSSNSIPVLHFIYGNSLLHQGQKRLSHQGHTHPLPNGTPLLTRNRRKRLAHWSQGERQKSLLERTSQVQKRLQLVYSEHQDRG